VVLYGSCLERARVLLGYVLAVVMPAALTILVMPAAATAGPTKEATTTTAGPTKEVTTS